MRKTKRFKNSIYNLIIERLGSGFSALVLTLVVLASLVYAWDPGPPQGSPVEGNVVLDLSSPSIETDFVTLPELASTTAPAANSHKMYYKTDAGLMLVDSEGTETAVGSTSTSASSACSGSCYSTDPGDPNVGLDQLCNETTIEEGWILAGGVVFDTNGITGKIAMLNDEIEGTYDGISAVCSNATYYGYDNWILAGELEQSVLIDFASNNGGYDFVDGGAYWNTKYYDMSSRGIRYYPSNGLTSKSIYTSANFRCTRPFDNSEATVDRKLACNLKTFSDCTNAGGVVFDTGSGYICKFTNASGGVECPSGWTQYDNWQKYSVGTFHDDCGNWLSSNPTTFSNQEVVQQSRGSPTYDYTYSKPSVAYCCSQDTASTHWVDAVPLDNGLFNCGYFPVDPITNPASSRTEIGCY